MLNDFENQIILNKIILIVVVLTLASQNLKNTFGFFKLLFSLPGSIL